MHIVYLVHIGRLDQIRSMLLVNAQEILKKVHTAVGIKVSFMMRIIRIEISTETMARIVRIYSTGLGVVSIDYFQIVVGASVARRRKFKKNLGFFDVLMVFN